MNLSMIFDDDCWLDGGRGDGGKKEESGNK